MGADRLRDYAAKRDFAKTPEPADAAAPREPGAAPVYVVQRHAARRLHWDLRLEIEGALASWAVTNEPSLDPGVKRLAVRTEDHPLAYARFEGSIPKGAYGAGAVSIWDSGAWRPEGDPAAGLSEGRLSFVLHGGRMSGRWHLVRMDGEDRRRPGGKPRENWLLIRATEQPRPAAPEPAPRAAGANAASPPPRLPFALAAPTDAPPRGEGWLHEVKFDGYRLQAAVGGGRVVLSTRGGLDWTARFQTIADALAAIEGGAVIDGEAIAENAQGLSDFGALQAALAAGDGAGLVFVAFDLLWADGADLRGEPLEARRDRLAALIAPLGEPVRFSEHFAAEGAAMMRHACRLGFEGVVSKRRGSAYPRGRDGAWVKSKCVRRQEFIVCGFTAGKGAAGGLGALVVGLGDAAAPVYAGRVGGGFSAAEASTLLDGLRPLIRPTPAFGAVPEAERRRKVTWVEPRLLIEAAFAGFTEAGVLRHAVFVGLREDRGPPAPRDAKASPRARLRAARSAGRSAMTTTLTHPDRVYWPADPHGPAVTKRELAAYYAAIWPRMGPHVVDRPLALLRLPEGVGGESFFQKNPGEALAALSRPLPDDDPVIVVADAGDMELLAQLAVLEVHPWGARAAAPDLCDRLVFDLDPGPGVGWEAVVAAAGAVRSALRERGLDSFVKLSGGKGLHVTVPLATAARWSVAKPFARSVAEALAAAEPDRYTATLSKAARKGKIFVDYLRNGRGATAVAPYSPRARPSAGLAVPVDWEALEGVASGDAVSLRGLDVAALLAKPDPWRDFAATRNVLPDARGRKAAGGRPPAARRQKRRP